MISKCEAYIFIGRALKNNDTKTAGDIAQIIANSERSIRKTKRIIRKNTLMLSRVDKKRLKQIID